MWKNKSEGKRSAENGIKVKSLLVLAQPLPDPNKTGCRNAFLFCYKRKASIKSAPSMSHFSNASILIVESRKDNHNQNLKRKNRTKIGSYSS